MMDAAWLQAGALGILAGVLAAIGKVLHSYFVGVHKQQNINDAWMHALIESDREERRKSSDRLTLLVETSVEANARLAESLGQLGNRLGQHEIESRAKHEQIMAAIGRGD